VNIGDIVYSDNGRHWRLVQDMGAGFWMAHAMTDKATHIRGISPPLHIISEKHVTLSPQNAAVSDA
jgi:hypothetical protein